MDLEDRQSGVAGTHWDAVPGRGRPTAVGLFTRRRRRGPGVIGRAIRAAAVLAALALVAYPLVIRPWHLRWGATDEELARSLPGDEIVPNSVYGYTRAITVDAPVAAVWPWLAQLGQGRGGLYSYDRLENLFGCDIHSADRILPEFQDIKAGDTFRLYREGAGPPPFTVARVEPDRALVLAGGNTYSWAFVLEPVGEQTTRLIVRVRSYAEPAWLAPVMGVEPLDFFMEQKMLRGIKERVEREERGLGG